MFTLCILLFYLLPEFSYRVIRFSIFYAACFSTQNTRECFALLFYIHFVKIIYFTHSKDKTRLAGRKEEGSGKMPIEAEKRGKGDRNDYM